MDCQRILFWNYQAIQSLWLSCCYLKTVIYYMQMFKSPYPALFARVHPHTLPSHIEDLWGLGPLVCAGNGCHLHEGMRWQWLSCTSGFGPGSLLN